MLGDSSESHSSMNTAQLNALRCSAAGKAREGWGSMEGFCMLVVNGFNPFTKFLAAICADLYAG